MFVLRSSSTCKQISNFKVHLCLHQYIVNDKSYAYSMVLRILTVLLVCHLEKMRTSLWRSIKVDTVLQWETYELQHEWLPPGCRHRFWHHLFRLCLRNGRGLGKWSNENPRQPSLGVWTEELAFPQNPHMSPVRWKSAV